MALFSECMPECVLENCFTRADIVRDAMLRQQGTTIGAELDGQPDGNPRQNGSPIYNALCLSVRN